MRSIERTVLGVGAAALLLASPAGAVVPDTEGFFIGLDLHSSHIGSEDEPENPSTGAAFIERNGGGLSLILGWGFTPSFPLRLNLSGASHDTSDPDVEFWISSVTVEAAYLFRDGQPFRPYLLGGLGGFSARSREDAFDFEVTGPGVVVGAGFAYFLSEHFALDVALRGDFINWDEQTARVTFENGTQAVVETPIEKEGSAAKILLGAAWWF